MSGTQKQEYTFSLTVSDDTWSFTIIDRNGDLSVKNITSTSIVNHQYVAQTTSPIAVPYASSTPVAFVEHGIMVPEIILTAILAYMDAVRIGASDVNTLIDLYSSGTSG